MEHLVRFTSAEGRDGYHTAASLDDALKFVERLRNNEEVDRVRLFRLQEVPIEFKAYYKVELRGGETPAAPVAEAPPAEPEAIEALPVPSPAGDEDEVGLVAAQNGPADAGNRRLFGRS